jgi:hypothetical protein
MTLKEKFKVLNCTDCDMPYCDTKCTILSTRELETLEKIAEEFAINFANWYEFMLRQNDNLNERFTPKELIKMFKKEKGL